MAARERLVASGEVAAGNMDLSTRTELTAADLRRTATSMDELTDAVAKNSLSAAG